MAVAIGWAADSRRHRGLFPAKTAARSQRWGRAADVSRAGGIMMVLTPGRRAGSRLSARPVAGLLQLDRDIADLARELVVASLVIVGHGRLAVPADVRAFIGREDVGLRAVDPPFGHFLAVDE